MSALQYTDFEKDAVDDALNLDRNKAEAAAAKDLKIFNRAYERIRACLGVDFCHADDDAEVIEIMLNPDCKLWVDRLGKGMSQIGFISPAFSKAAMRVVAALMNQELNSRTPLLEGYLPWNGARLAAQVPPVVENTSFSIRKKAVSIFTLAQYVSEGILSEKHHSLILQFIKERKNILVVGATTSGKTTLTNALINEISTLDNESRVLIMEDTGEIQCSAENKIMYRTTDNVKYEDLLQTSLRMRPDRIIVGEVRSFVALDMLDAWNTGHEGGLCTLHANDAQQALLRLESLINRNNYAPKDVREVIAQAVNVIIFIRKTPEYGRRVEQILTIDGYDKDSSYKLTVH